MSKHVYSFGEGAADGDGKMKDTLGGKGAGLAEMSRAGLPVPPGFTISTEVCNVYFRTGSRVPGEIQKEMLEALGLLERRMGQKLGDAENPLLVSVRSGAKFSMPGMMDTILNLGLNDATLAGLERKSGNPRFARDCYRRFMQMFGNVVLEIPKSEFEHLFEARKKKAGARFDTDLTAKDLDAVIAAYKNLVRRRSGREFPQDALEQLTLARDAVFRSWHNPRAIHYRKMNQIPDNLGTAVNVQAMVFGNLGNTSATGVGFTRNPATGEPEFYGEFLINAQGEDVVAGIRTPQPISELRRAMPGVYDQLREITTMLERHYRDVQDFEFTIEDGKLYMLQTRNGKRTGPAAVRIAVDMVNEKLISREEAVLRVDPQQLDQLLHPLLDPKSRAKLTKIAAGLPASPGAAVGTVVFTADDAVERAAHGPVILVRAETVPDDIHGMEVAKGILTSRGGMTSHAAVVARGMGTPCVAGAGDIEVSERARELSVAAGGKRLVLREGDWLSLDGSTGEVYAGRAATVEPDPSSGALAAFMSWADQFRGAFG
ncbi:MAG: pyruvate, phosphate dikinase, partial [Acidobacteria bacterium]|nr:pyruvate, phosphate dikinase [Acidobacteriota bacterium]